MPKIDGYRLIAWRDGSRVRLFTRNGHDWTKRYPLIVEAALRNRQTWKHSHDEQKGCLRPAVGLGSKAAPQPADHSRRDTRGGDGSPAKRTARPGQGK